MTIEAPGKRLASYRRAAKFRTPAELARATRTGTVTTATIQNLESGRKGEISTAQLVDLTRTLRIAPASLMADVRYPFNESTVSGFTNWQLVEALGIPALSDSAPDAIARRIIQSTRALIAVKDGWRDALMERHNALRSALDNALEEIEYDTPFGTQTSVRDAVEESTLVLSAMSSAARSAFEELERHGVVDLDWGRGPWLTFEIPRDGVDQAAP